MTITNDSKDDRGRTLGDVLEHIDLSAGCFGDPIYLFYLACRNDQLESALSEVQRGLSIEDNAVYRCVHEQPTDMTVYLEEMAEEISQHPDQRVLIVVSGMENHEETYKKQGLADVMGHMWAQSFLHLMNKEFYETLEGKTVFVVPHVSKSAGDRYFNERWKEVATSHFTEEWVNLE